MFVYRLSHDLSIVILDIDHGINGEQYVITAYKTSEGIGRLSRNKIYCNSKGYGYIKKNNRRYYLIDFV